MEKISVILSTYNNEDTIGESVNSILNQQGIDLELLICDDGSTDSTYQILSNLEKKDNRLKIIQNVKNIGLTKSLNKLIKISNGVYIARQDADDFSLPDRLKTQLNFLDRYNLDACTTRAIKVQGGGIIPNFSYYVPYRLIVKIKNPFIHGTLFIRKSVLNKIGNYDEKFKYSQDYKLMSDLIDAKYKIKIINKPLYKLNTINNISSINKTEQKYYSDCVRKKVEPTFLS